MCLVEILVASCIGFAAGFGIWHGYSSARLNAVIAARAASYTKDAPKSGVSRASRGIFASLIFAAFPVVRGWCLIFNRQHPFAIVLLAMCAVSTGIWLAIASDIRDTVDSERKSRINEFISSPAGSSAPPPPRVNPRPRWLAIWEWVNIAVFSLFLATVLRVL
jgi:hypothetical protein